MDDLIQKALSFAKDFFKNEFSGHDYYHTLRVFNNSKLIAQNEACDEEIVYLSAILHDVDDIKIVGEQKERFENAKRFLNSINYPVDKIEKICHIISQVSFKKDGSTIPDSIEGKIVQDADRLDAIGAIGIARTFAFGGTRNRDIYIPKGDVPQNMTDEEKERYNFTTINHFYDKLFKLKDLMNTQTAKQIAERRHRFMEEYINEFYDEWDGKK